MSGRRVRVEQALRDTLAEMIDREVKDPRVKGAGLVTVQRVELNADLSVARVYVSVFGDDITAKKAMAGLAAAGTFLRGPLGRRLHLQRPPELRFVRDESPEIVRHLAEVVRDDQARARAAGRDDAAPGAAGQGDDAAPGAAGRGDPAAGPASAAPAADDDEDRE